MPEFKIRYKLEDEGKNPDEVRDRHMIGGGVCVRYGDSILTKSIYETSTGYIGNWVFDDIVFGFINSVYLLMGEATNTYEIMETFVGFYMESRNDYIFISIIPFGFDERDVEDFKASFPTGYNGVTVPAKQYYNEVIRVGHEFLQDITKKYNNLNKEELDKYKNLLENAERMVEEYNNTH